MIFRNRKFSQKRFVLKGLFEFSYWLLVIGRLVIGVLVGYPLGAKEIA
jgi:hypothetical protein